MKAFLTGLGIGVGLGVLFAPDKGEATRTKVRERLNSVFREFGGQVGEANVAVDETESILSEASSGGPDQVRSEFSTRGDQAREIRPSASSDPINSLSREELLNVNGIGPVLADKIISGRPYSSRQDFVERGILPQSTLEELERELVRRERRSA